MYNYIENKNIGAMFMEKVFPNYKHYLKIGDLYLFVYYLLSPFICFDVIFELIFHQDFYLSNLIFAIILF